jgi:hypothetical protein
MTRRILIDIEGVDDPSIAAEVDSTIRESFAHRGHPGTWHVRVSPARRTGRWDIRVGNIDAHHKLSIAVPAPLLAALIPLRLRESLERVAPPPPATGADADHPPTAGPDEETRH